jgi:hypothetical protein
MNIDDVHNLVIRSFQLGSDILGVDGIVETSNEDCKRLFLLEPVSMEFDCA